MGEGWELNDGDISSDTTAASVYYDAHKSLINGNNNGINNNNSSSGSSSSSGSGGSNVASRSGLTVNLNAIGAKISSGLVSCTNGLTPGLGGGGGGGGGSGGGSSGSGVSNGGIIRIDMPPPHREEPKFPRENVKVCVGQSHFSSRRVVSCRVGI